MKHTWTLISTSLLITLTTACNPSATEWGDKVIACGDHDIYIVNTRTSTPDSLDIEWHWNVSEAKGQIPDEYQNRNRSIDDCKAVDGGKRLLVTSSSHSTLLLDIATRQCLFYAYTPMAHSADMLPRNRIVVANSTHPKGNSLELYEVGKSEQCLWRDSLYSGHGAVWVEKHQSLYALGYQELRRYTLVDWDTDTPSLHLEETFALPDKSGHELSMVNPDCLLCSAHNHVYLFDLKTHTFKPFEPLFDKGDIKSANYNDRTGRIIYTQAETSWWTNHIYLTNPDQTLTFSEDFHLYKVRVL